MFDPYGPGVNTADSYYLNESVTKSSPMIGRITDVSETTQGDSVAYEVSVQAHGKTADSDLEKVEVPASQFGEVRALEVGTPVIMERPVGSDNPKVSHVVHTDTSEAPLTHERDWRVVKGDALIEIVRNDYDQLMLNVGRLGDRQPDSKNVTRSGMDMGLMQNLSSGAFRLYDASGMGLSADGKGNFVWNWSTMSAPAAIYSGGGGASPTSTGSTIPSGSSQTTPQFEDTSTYGGIGGGDSYTKQALTTENADVIVPDDTDIRSAINNAVDGQNIYLQPQEYDLTNNKPTLSANNVTIGSDRGIEGSDGAIIVETEMPEVDNSRATIYITGNGNKFDSMSFSGPVDQYVNAGPSNPPPAAAALNFYNGAGSGEVANVAINGFTTYGVSATDAGPLHVHHCNITGIKMDGRGYGCNIKRSSGMNVFEYNFYNDCRHSVTSSGREGESYTVRHCIFGPIAHNQQIDIHSDDNLHPDFVAGNTFRVYNNEIRQLEDSGQEVVNVRGVPRDVFEFNNNWVHMRNKQQAVRQTEGGDTIIATAADPNSFQSMQVRNNSWGPKEPSDDIGPQITTSAGQPQI